MTHFFISSDLFSYQQCDGRGSISILIALSVGNLLQELHFFLAGHKNDFVITEDHDSISQFITKEPCLWEKTTVTTVLTDKKNLCSKSMLFTKLFVKMKIFCICSNMIASREYLRFWTKKLKI